MPGQQQAVNCDYLIVGGGSAGSILARRIAEAGIGHVILLEAGKSDEDDSSILDLSRLDQQGSTTEWGFTAAPMRGRSQRIQYSRAKMLGGCGGHNDCAFLVPPYSDFDHWSTLGATGWSGREVAPFFKRVEDRVKIKACPSVSPLSEKFIRAGESLGLKRVNFRQEISEGVGVFPLNVSGPMRQSSSVAYLHPLDELPSNLQVKCHTIAEKLVVTGNRVTGCVTTHGEIQANKEVLLCCGAIQTPQLLMVSGIGPSEHLKELGIRTEVDLQGVGQNLADHAAANIAMELSQPLPEWTLTPCEVTMMLRVYDDTPVPDLLYHFVLRMREKYTHNDPAIARLNGVKISPNVTRPKSRGQLRLRSRFFTESPDIDLNYFSDPEDYDLRTLIEGLRFARKVAGSDILQEAFKGEALPGALVQSDNDLADYVRETCETVYHPAGTCRMGQQHEKMSVVTPDLKVKGIDGLRVCDASVFPSMVTVNINNTVMMVAEKSAYLIIGR